MQLYNCYPIDYFSGHLCCISENVYMRTYCVLSRRLLCVYWNREPRRSGHICYPMRTHMPLMLYTPTVISSLKTMIPEILLSKRVYRLTSYYGVYEKLIWSAKGPLRPASLPHCLTFSKYLKNFISQYCRDILMTKRASGSLIIALRSLVHCVWNRFNCCNLECVWFVSTGEGVSIMHVVYWAIFKDKEFGLLRRQTGLERPARSLV